MILVCISDWIPINVLLKYVNETHFRLIKRGVCCHSKCNTMVPSDVIKWGSFGNDLHNIRIPRLVQRMAVATKWGGKLRHLVTLVPIQRMLFFQEVSQLGYLFEEERTLFKIIFWSIISLFLVQESGEKRFSVGVFYPLVFECITGFPK